MAGNDSAFQLGEDIGCKGQARDEREEYLRAEDAQMYGATYGAPGGGVPGWPGGGMGAGPTPTSGTAPYGREHGQPVSPEEARSRERRPPEEMGPGAPKLERTEPGRGVDTSGGSPRRGMGAEGEEVHEAEGVSHSKTDRST